MTSPEPDRCPTCGASRTEYADAIYFLAASGVELSYCPNPFHSTEDEAS